MMEEVLAYLVWAHGHAKGLMVPARDVRLAFRGNSIKDRAGVPSSPLTVLCVRVRVSACAAES
jgi:hypothetical protein